MLPKISIIVPVYKIEKDISRCINSIIGNTYQNFELLLIDDGSPDNSGKICDEYAKKDRRIKVIHKENGGVSSARNTGIREASGEYIMFVDGDDWIEENSFEILSKKIETLDSDLFIFGIVKDLYSNNKLIKSEINALVKEENLNIYELSNKFEYLFNTIRMLPPWMYLFKSEILKREDLFFNEELVAYEDFDFNMRYLKNCKNITIIPDIIYHYIIDVNVNQLAKRNKINLVSNMNAVSKSILEFLDNIQANLNVKEYMYSYIFDLYVLSIKKIAIHRKDIKYIEIRNILKELRNDDIFRESIEKYGNKLKFYRIFYYLIDRKMYRIADILLYRIS